MRITKTDLICGLDAATARDLMRKMRLRHSDAERVAYFLGEDESRAEEVLQALKHEGFVASEEDDGTWWTTTIKGNALAMASFGKPMSRARAEKLLEAVLRRVREYNADPTRLLSVTEMRVFGSYLKPEAQELGDLDLAVRYAHRDNETFIQDSQDQAYAESSPQSLTEEFLYPQTNLLRRLKQRSPLIKITTENIERFTDSWDIVYKIETDPTAIPLTEKHLLVNQD